MSRTIPSVLSVRRIEPRPDPLTATFPTFAVETTLGPVVVRLHDRHLAAVHHPSGADVEQVTGQPAERGSELPLSINGVPVRVHAVVRFDGERFAYNAGASSVSRADWMKRAGRHSDAVSDSVRAKARGLAVAAVEAVAAAERGAFAEAQCADIAREIERAERERAERAAALAETEDRLAYLREQLALWSEGASR